MSKVRDDPRDAALEVPYTLPPAWHSSTGAGDVLGGSGMMLGGLTMVTRNPYIGWSTLFLGLWAWLNSHPMRTKDGGNAGQGALIAGVALIAAYFPRFIVAPAAST